MQCLLGYDFPGNVRELKNIIERVSVLSPGPVITLEDLPADLRTRHEPAAVESGCLSEALAAAEKRCIVHALTQCGGNRTRAASALGISRKNLWEKMKQLAIEF